MPRRKQPAIPDELLDQLLSGSDPRAALAEGGLLDGLKKALAERALNAELDHHLETGEPDGRTNGRNGYSAKSVFTGTGKLDLQIPRDRLSTFDPQLIAKYQRRFPGFDDKIVSMYARGMSTREIQGHLRELYCRGSRPPPPAEDALPQRPLGLGFQAGDPGGFRGAGRGFLGLGDPPLLEPVEALVRRGRPPLRFLRPPPGFCRLPFRLRGPRLGRLPLRLARRNHLGGGGLGFLDLLQTLRHLAHDGRDLGGALVGNGGPFLCDPRSPARILGGGPCSP